MQVVQYGVPLAELFCGNLHWFTEELTLIKTASDDVDKYEFVWTSVTDEGHLIGRATVLDDGNYHYVLSSTVDADLIEEYQEIWNGIFESFELA